MGRSGIEEKRSNLGVSGAPESLGPVLPLAKWKSRCSLGPRLFNSKRTRTSPLASFKGNPKECPPLEKVSPKLPGVTARNPYPAGNFTTKVRDFVRIVTLKEISECVPDATHAGEADFGIQWRRRAATVWMTRSATSHLMMSYFISAISLRSVSMSFLVARSAWVSSMFSLRTSASSRAAASGIAWLFSRSYIFRVSTAMGGLSHHSAQRRKSPTRFPVHPKTFQVKFYRLFDVLEIRTRES